MRGILLHGSLRESDYAYRYSGEKFFHILLGLDAEAARSRADEIRLAYWICGSCTRELRAGPINASIGVAAAPEDCTVDRLMQKADAALLFAKSQGRNRVVGAAVCKERKVA